MTLEEITKGFTSNVQNMAKNVQGLLSGGAQAYNQSIFSSQGQINAVKNMAQTLRQPIPTYQAPRLQTPQINPMPQAKQFVQNTQQGVGNYFGNIARGAQQDLQTLPQRVSNTGNMALGVGNKIFGLTFGGGSEPLNQQQLMKNPAYAKGYGTLGDIASFLTPAGAEQHLAQAGTTGLPMLAGIIGGKKAATFERAVGKYSSLLDKNVKFQIPDNQAYLKVNSIKQAVQDGIGKLGDILTHNKLFNNYPEFKNLRVIFDSKLPEGNLGSFNPKTFTISMNPQSKRMLPTLLHEVQHAIQTKEGFATGGNLKQFNNIPSSELNNIKDLFNRQWDYVNTLKQGSKEWNLANDELQKLAKQLDTPIQKYSKLAGEIEARAVEARKGLNAKQFMQSDPYASQGIPLKDVITKFDNGVSSSIKPNAVNQTIPTVPLDLAYKEAALFPSANNYAAIANRQYGISFEQATKIWNEARAAHPEYANLSMAEKLPLHNEVTNALNELKKPNVANQTINDTGKVIDKSVSGNTTAVLNVKGQLLSYSKQGGKWVSDISGSEIKTPQAVKLLEAQVEKPSQILDELIKNGEMWDSGNLSLPQTNALKDLQAKGLVEKIKGTPGVNDTANGVADVWKLKTPTQTINDVGANVPKPSTTTTPIVEPLQGQAKSMLQGETPKVINPSTTVYNAEANSNTVAKLLKNESKNTEKAAKADFNQWQKALFEQEGATKRNLGDITGAIKKTTSTISKPEGLNDISGFSANARDVFRNFKAVYGKRYNEVKTAVLDPFDASKGRLIDNYKGWIKKVNTEIEGNLGIKKGSAESAAVQEYGEKKLTELDLVDKFGQDKANKIIKADKWFRTNYDNLLDEVNSIRAAIFPNQPDKIIPKRTDYYRHFREMGEGVQGLLNIFEGPTGISSKLAGISYQTEPKSKFLSFAQKRLGNKSDIDAVGGFLDYIKAAEYAKNIDPHTAKFRALADELAQNTAEGPMAGQLNNFILGLNRFADDLAGKTNPADRYIQEVIPGGRTAMQALNWVNSRVKANVILGNLASAVAQAGNIPQGIADAGVTNVPRGISRTLAGIVSKNDPMTKSSFIKERYFRGFETFDRGVIDNAKKGAAWITGVLDEAGTKFIWNMEYEKALSQGVENAVKYADDATRGLVAGRGIGEVPLIQKAKAFQLVAPFQLEVGNLWFVMKDMMDEKAFGKLATLFVSSYLFNRLAEQIRGSDVIFDPIQATIEGAQAFNEEEDKKRGSLRFGGRLAGEFLGNIPMGQSVAAMYPEYGNTELGLPTRKDLFGKGDPTRFGSGLVSQQALTDPLFKLLPPFGGGQLKKSIEGIKTYTQGYSETPKGAMRFPVEQNIPNAVKSTMFGQYATPEAREYFNNEGRPLSENQTKSVKEGTKTYQDLMATREENKKIEDTKLTIKNNQSGSSVIGDTLVYWDKPTQTVKTKTINRVNPSTSTTKKTSITTKSTTKKATVKKPTKPKAISIKKVGTYKTTKLKMPKLGKTKSTSIPFIKVKAFKPKAYKTPKGRTKAIKLV